MFISSGIVALAKNQGSRKLPESVRPGELFTRAEDVVDLLAGSTSPAAQPGARKLLQAMSETPWQVIRGAHRSAGDGTLHVTIAISSTRYHLRLDGNLCVFDITCIKGEETHRPAGKKPFVGPGA